MRKTMFAKAAILKAATRFQLEAAIQSAHCNRLHLREVAWQVNAQLSAYRMVDASTADSAVGHVAALGRSVSPKPGSATLAVMKSTVASSQS